MTNARLWCSLCLNFVAALPVLCSCVAFFLRGGWGNMKSQGKRALSYFTVDSNLLCAAACCCLCIWDAAALRRGGQATVPRWLDLVKYTGTVSVGLTFFTVLLYLFPVARFDLRQMYGGWNFFLHFLCPLCAMLSWAFVERGAPIAFPWTLLGLIPTVLYGVLYLERVVWHRRWKDFYRFNPGGRWPMTVPVILSLSYAVAAGLWALR